MASGDDSKSLQRVLEVNCVSLVLVCANFMEHPAHRDHVASLAAPVHLSVWDRCTENASVECALCIAQILWGLVLLPCTLGWCAGTAFIACKAKGGNQ